MSLSPNLHIVLRRFTKASQSRFRGERDCPRELWYDSRGFLECRNQDEADLRHYLHSPRVGGSIPPLAIVVDYERLTTIRGHSLTKDITEDIRD